MVRFLQGVRKKIRRSLNLCEICHEALRDPVVVIQPGNRRVHRQCMNR